MGGLSQFHLLQDLAVVMITAALVTLLFHRLRQPVVLGYILAGVVIGPYTPPFPLLSNMESIRTLGDLGVVFLMFALGLQFSLRTLRDVGATAVIVSALEILLLLLVGYSLGRWFGWNRMDSVFLGAMLSITSTTIIVRTLGELGLMKARFAQLIFGIQIVEDTLGMTLIALLSGLAVSGQVELGLAAAALGRVGLFLAVVVMLGLIAVPRLLRRVARYQNDEILLITVLGLCFGVTLASVKLGHSLVLGAFLAGTIIGETREIGRIKELTEPVRDMFSAVFFVTIGTLLDPAMLVEYARPILLISAAVIVGKIMAFAGGTFVTGHDLRTSIRVGACMVPIGELSFIIASLGLSLGVTSEFLYPIAVSVSAITMPLTPYLARHAEPLLGWLDRHAPHELLNTLAVYSGWVDRLRHSRRDSPARRMIRKWIWQMGLNVALATAAFAVAPVVAGRIVNGWQPLQAIPDWLGGPAGIVWLGAALLAMPALIATVRKLGALAMLLAELSAGLGKGTAAIRGIVQHIIYYAGFIGLVLWVLLLSATLLPRGAGLWVLLGAAGVITGVSWRFFIQIHAKGQVALRETLAAPVEPLASELDRQPVPLLAAAQMERVTLPAASVARGRLIREVALRSRTGASIIGIDRADGSVVNPGPDEELRPGDRLLLLGTPEQLTAARAALTTETE